MEKILPSSTLNYKPTPKQIRAITKLATALRISEPIENDPKTRKEARDLIYYLRRQLRSE